jgi:hypothetical protein
VPGPLEEMVPEAPITRCQGIGGLVLGGKNFKAAHKALLNNSIETNSFLLTLTYVSRVIGHSNQLRDVSYNDTLLKHCVIMIEPNLNLTVACDATARNASYKVIYLIISEM